MATAAQELFGFIQERQRMALDQQKFAEAKRQFNINADLSQIQTQQNSRRLDQAEEFGRAEIGLSSERNQLQREITNLNRDQQLEAKRQAQVRESFLGIEAVAAGQAVAGPEGLVAQTPAQRAAQARAFKQEDLDAVLKTVDSLGLPKHLVAPTKAAVIGASGPATAFIQGQAQRASSNELNQIKAVAFGAPAVEIGARALFTKDIEAIQNSKGDITKLTPRQQAIVAGRVQSLDDLTPDMIAGYLSEVANADEGSLAKKYGASPDIMAGLALQKIIAQNQAGERIDVSRLKAESDDIFSRIDRITGGQSGLQDVTGAGGGTVRIGASGPTNGNAGAAATRQGIPLEEQVVRKPGEPPPVQFSPTGQPIGEDLSHLVRPPVSTGDPNVGPQPNDSLLSAISEIMSSFVAPSATARGELPINLEQTLAPQISKFNEAQRIRESRRRALQEQLELRKQGR